MPELFSVNEAAAIAEVSPETIRTALEKKSVKPSHKRKTGRAVVISSPLAMCFS